MFRTCGIWKVSFTLAHYRPKTTSLGWANCLSLSANTNISLTLIASSPATWRNVAHRTLSDFYTMPMAEQKSWKCWLQSLQFSARLPYRHKVGGGLNWGVSSLFFDHHFWHQVKVKAKQHLGFCLNSIKCGKSHFEVAFIHNDGVCWRVLCPKIFFLFSLIGSFFS